MQEILQAIITELKTMTKSKITVESKIKDLGIDSLDLLQSVTNLEEKLNIQISDEELLTIKSVKDLLSIIETKLN
ncbi:phosphopantetheine-binding protein [Mycoplasma phocoenae]|uniref:Acyl carrier protein n=1 Tax=Mycoplasma phocoenae TaxID=754517 RepID=A0A858U1T3_9MOLU|nr:phosphopantetheine-binding protein [Mycoplasma phocoenae]QJG67084.1 acyl carrier protein [Mycoplasma phocoenae]